MTYRTIATSTELSGSHVASACPTCTVAFGQPWASIMACAAATVSGVRVDSDEATAGSDHVHDRREQRARAAADIGNGCAARDARCLPEVLLGLPCSLGHELITPQFVLAERERVARCPSVAVTPAA
jgi:hypothetical protein